MFKKTKLCTGMLAAFGSGMFMAAHPALAQETQRVEITGSSIKRISGESALPVQVITAEDIKKSGVTTVTDLIQNLPAMQGFTSNSQSINGGGGGTTTASLHSLGEDYTLVLLNGRRVAPLNTGAAVNLNSIPLAAIDRVEVLTDGASALYGSDAIAGVVNFVTKKDSTEGLATAAAYIPQKSGGGSYTASISKGFGDLNSDKYNFLVSASFDKQKALFAKQRSFSKTGILKFRDQGQDQEIALVSSNSVPANIAATLSDGSTVLFNAYKLSNGGACPANHVAAGDRCLFDFPSVVQSIPESERIALFGSGRIQVSDAVSIFSEIGWSRFANNPIYAPPAQPGLPLNDALIASSVTPFLEQLGKGGTTVTSATMNLRLFDAGGRQDKYQTDALHFVLGADATVGTFDFTGSYTHSENKFWDKAAGGYSSLVAFNALVDSGTWNPLTALAGSSTDLVAPIVLRQTLDQSKSSIDVVSGRGTTTLGKLAGGDIGVGVGIDYMKQKFSDTPSAIAMGANALQPDYPDAVVGGSGGALPFDSSRNSYGLYAELVLPFSKMIELSGSARYDSYGTVKNTQNFDANGNPIASESQGKKSSSGTYKVSLRVQPTPDILFRGSIGTGFKAPTLANITKPLQAFGNTGFQDCPPGLEASKAAFCGPIAQEYNIQDGGNPATDSSALKPEKSTQWTLGMRVEPASGFSVGFDLWSVKLKDQISKITENTAFSDGVKYGDLFTVAPDPITGTPTLTFLSVPINTGKARYQGIDLDGEAKFATPVGRLTTRLRGTYMIHADYQTPGTPGYINSMSKIGADGQVTFRWLANLSASLESGAFTHTLTASFKPGYMDDTIDYCRTDANGDCLLTKFGDLQGRYVSSYTLFDWQTKYDINKDFSVTAGIRNLLDKDPPFSLVDQSGTGNARGFDGRYTDPIGRQFYLAASYKF